jgi:acetolactate synthase-1/2/3 large subunit
MTEHREHAADAAMPARRVSPVYGSDMVAELLDRLGIPLIAFTPGATFRCLHDSLVNHAGPGIVECLHEEISVAVAHGDAKARAG